MKPMEQILEEYGIVPVVVLEKAEDAIPLADAVYAGGLSCAEVTFRTDAAEVGGLRATLLQMENLIK